MPLQFADLFLQAMCAGHCVVEDKAEIRATLLFLQDYTAQLELRSKISLAEIIP